MDVEMEKRTEPQLTMSLVRRATNLGLPFGALEAIAELKRELRTVELMAIAEARDKGATWEVVAQALGITRQALHQRMQTVARRGSSSDQVPVEAGSGRLEAEQPA